MCKPSSPSTPSMDVPDSCTKPPSSLLLELAASNDLQSFKNAIEIDNIIPIDTPSLWYCRSISTKAMCFCERTPLQIAALYGSTSVVQYILTHATVDVNRKSSTDNATALHCAAAGGAATSSETINLLINSGADVDALDAANHRPADVIPKQFSNSVFKYSLEKKKEYPPDLTLPDIKNGIYGTDEFRMYTFKVKPCSRAYSHDWTECPFVHPGENARRRDPRKYQYSCVPCPEFRKGSCRNGDGCEYAHGVFECWLHPAQYRTRLCKDETGCNRRVCFFAHRREELRSVNPTAASVNGMGLNSPRDMAAALMMSGPMSPSAVVSSGLGTSWMNQSPNLQQLQTSRLKSSLSSRDLELEFELMGLEGYQQKLLDEISNAAAAASSPRSNWSGVNSLPAVAASRAADYSNFLGSIEPSVMRSQLANQSINQQLLAGYGNNLPLPSSPTMNSSSSFGLDNSMVKAIINSRSAAFAKRSQSFVDRGAVARYPSGLSAAPVTAGLTDWGSPSGKLDWGMEGEELNKFRKSASFAFRGNNQGAVGVAPAVSQGFDEPDLSWVQSLVKDKPASAPIGRGGGFDYSPNQYQVNGGSGGGGDYLGSEIFNSWGDQLYVEQEQMVA